MCGIAGFISSRFQPERLDRGLQAALSRQGHRGPDDHGTVVWPAPPQVGGTAVGFGCRRLAILDLTPHGHQPMTTADGRFAVTFNGEIYNYRELRSELEHLGVRFRSAGDTEVLLEAVARWGIDALTRLTGMFAFALHDRVAGVAYLARDPFGIKPLYYAYDGDALVFASEIAAMLEFRGVGRGVDPLCYREFLATANTDVGDRTLFADIRRVPAAHYLEVPLSNPRAARAIRYWSLPLDETRECTFAEAAAEVREAFVESVGLHLRSDAPLGFALSGGIDSSAVVIVARRLLGPGADLRAFTFVPDDPRLDEERYVDLVARSADLITYKLRLTPDELERDIDRLSDVQGEPFASPVIYAQYRVLGLARDHGVKVVLGGQGSDEMLAGYERYFPARLASLLKRGRLGAAAGLLRRGGRSYRGSRTTALRSATASALPPGPARQLRRVWSSFSGRAAWIDDRWFTNRGAAPAVPWQARGRFVMREMLAHNLLESQVEALLRYEDRSAMSFSVENRVPFLTPNLARLLFSLPEEYLLARDGTRKAVFRAALRGMVPDPILDRTDKIGFSVPMASWFDALRPWLMNRLGNVAGLPGLRAEFVRQQTALLDSGRPASDPYAVWRCVSLSHWAERFDARFI